MLANNPIRRCFYPLHGKGLLTLCLLILAESVTFTNAVKVWASAAHQTPNSRQSTGRSSGTSRSGSNNKIKEECYESDGEAGTCPSLPGQSTTSNLVLQPLKSLSKRFSLGGKQLHPPFANTDDCCAHFCPTCITEIARGGHSHHHSHSHGTSEAIDAAAAAAAAKLPYDIPLNAWKVIFQAILTTINVVCWLVPLRSKKISENKLALSIANAFSGGVFLSLAFGHLIPECVHGFHDYNEVTPYLLVLAGYLLIFFIEKVAFDAHDILHEMEAGGSGGHGHSHSHGHHHHGSKASNGESTNSVATSGRSAVILLGALAVHSILEMAALGLADTFPDCAILSLSIALHQPAESIALLVAFLKSGMPQSQIIRFLSIFSAMGPIGVALGMAVNEFAAPIVDATMVAIVAGTFVYVGATEVIPEEWEDSTHKWKKFAALMSGIISILIITQYTMTLEM